MLAVSNIIWSKGKEAFSEFVELLKNHNIEGVELALSCIWNEPKSISNKDIQWIKEVLEKRNLKVSALHSLTYTRPDLTLFDSDLKLREYIKHYFDLAHKLDCKNIVFGSPKARMRNGKPVQECDQIFINFLSEVDTYSDDISFNIEPLPVEYCDYLNSYKHALNIASSGFKNIKVQLDLKAIVKTRSDDWAYLAGYSSYFNHLQVSDLDFNPPSQKDLKYHDQLKNFLLEINYQGYVSMESVVKSNNPTVVENSINSFKQMYSG
ncbi:MAG: sugar phosphate isomerase/epimerase [Lentisphaeraceae bacterium]|nr:sugar phosphate isomerase/epimerase [Lentisphaeraceae bacterium]